MNEWEFTAAAASWIDAAIKANPDLSFSEARCEQRGRGSAKRRDLTLLDRNGRPALTGEVKMPFQPEGASPYRAKVVTDARRKAQRAAVDYFFTWNVNRCVLWPTTPAESAEHEREYREWNVADIHDEKHLQIRQVLDRLQRWIPRFLHEAADIVFGDAQLGRKPPDERFIDGLEAALEQPILHTTEALYDRYQYTAPRAELQRWMREDQGWVLHDPTDDDGVLEDLNRAAQFANYDLVNKLVFHEALLKRFGSQLQRIDVPEHIDTGERLRTHFEGYFDRACRVTGDYETVFGDDRDSIGSRIPFYADPAVAFWRMLVGQVHEFDFSKLDYEIIGAIFERLISPEERHKYGQYYTRAEVADLINSFCIRTGKEKVMDPACGGGTFLVRAYARKRELQPGADHSHRLKDLFGIDLSHFASHLTTINLATRDLIDDANYPQVTRANFFDIQPGKALMNLPTKITAGGLGSGQKREVVIPPLDAVIGNPPYVRQEGIPKAPDRKKSPPPGTKEHYKLVAEQGIGVDLSGRSDLHAYFWLHAADFLHHGGWLGLLTSSQWLDVEYGFRLQEFMLRHFEIHAVFESLDEPWFVGARVATCATLLRRQRDETERMNQTVRFVQLRRPIAEILEHDGTAGGAMAAADRFRDHLLSLNENTVTDQYRARLVRQGDLWNEGVTLGKLLGKSKRGPAKQPDRQQGDYYGGKWGRYLRAPDLWAELMNTHGERFVPLGEVADVRFGVKSGKDDFFFPIDASDECLTEHTDDRTFKREFGVDRKQVEQGKVKLVWCGEDRGELRPIEAKYLEPEIHSLMEIDEFTVGPENCSRMIFLTGQPVENLPRYAKAYVKWGEQQGWHSGATCAAREHEGRHWHDLTASSRADIVLPKIMQYRIMSFMNPNRYYQASALLGLYEVDGENIEIITGVLNSTFTVLSMLLYARGLGNEANIQLDVYLAQMMLIPDPRKGSKQDRQRVAKAFQAMTGRKALSFVSERRRHRHAYTQRGKADELDQLSDQTELDMADRHALDDAVLRMIGVKDKAQRQRMLDGLYAHLRQHFEWVRQKEERAIANKKTAKKKGPAGPGTIAAEIAEQVKQEHPEAVGSWEERFMAGEPTFDTYDLPEEGAVELLDDLIHQNTLEFRKGKRLVRQLEVRSAEQAGLLRALSEAGVRGLVRVPHDAEKAKQLHEQFERWLEQRNAQIDRLIEQRTSDPGLHAQVWEAIPRYLPLANV